MKKPKISKEDLVSDTCRFKCAIFGTGKLCKGRLNGDEQCLGFKKKSDNEKVPAEIGNGANVNQADTSPKKPIKLYTFESRNAILKGNNSICDDCLHELDGLCKLKQMVNLSKVKDCNEVTPRVTRAVI